MAPPSHDREKVKSDPVHSRPRMNWVEEGKDDRRKRGVGRGEGKRERKRKREVTEKER